MWVLGIEIEHEVRVKSLYRLSHLTGLVKCYISNHLLSQKLIVPTCNSTWHHNAAGIIFWSLFHPSLNTMQPNANSYELAKIINIFINASAPSVAVLKIDWKKKTMFTSPVHAPCYCGGTFVGSSLIKIITFPFYLYSMVTKPCCQAYITHFLLWQTYFLWTSNNVFLIFNST